MILNACLHSPLHFQLCQARQLVLTEESTTRHLQAVVVSRAKLSKSSRASVRWCSLLRQTVKPRLRPLLDQDVIDEKLPQMRHCADALITLFSSSCACSANLPSTRAAPAAERFQVDLAAAVVVKAAEEMARPRQVVAPAEEKETLAAWVAGAPELEDSLA
ncbi:hypothetical protein AB1Y20_003118 [Prymnesium parvum]|uniref:Uncharacterized protein n=1 Tax=Prymnesium parvum TaxID=97485 RepID=A0AB34JB53_PRYPA